MQTFPFDLSNLKRLMIGSKLEENEGEFGTRAKDLTGFDISVKDLNKFTQLEQLHIDGISVSGEERLNLPKLKILRLWLPDDNLIMDLPCLTALCTFELKPIHLVDPKTVHFIDIRLIADCSRSEIAGYENVTHLKVAGILSLGLTENLHILYSLPNLQMLDGDQERVKPADNGRNNFTYELVEKLYGYFLAEKRSLRRDGLKICFGQIEIEDGKQFKDYEVFRDYFDD